MQWRSGGYLEVLSLLNFIELNWFNFFPFFRLNLNLFQSYFFKLKLLKLPALKKRPVEDAKSSSNREITRTESNSTASKISDIMEIKESMETTEQMEAKENVDTEEIVENSDSRTLAQLPMPKVKSISCSRSMTVDW